LLPNLESSDNDQVVTAVVKPLKESLIQFFQNQLKEFQPRDDYKELLQLALIFLGDNLSSIHINAPEAYHRARWMSKMIYTLKIYLFRSQFQLTTTELSRLQQFNTFVVKLYSRHGERSD